MLRLSSRVHQFPTRDDQQAVRRAESRSRSLRTGVDCQSLVVVAPRWQLRLCRSIKYLDGQDLRYVSQRWHTLDVLEDNKKPELLSLSVTMIPTIALAAQLTLIAALDESGFDM